MRRKAMTLREVAVILAVLFALFWFLFPFGHVRSGRWARERRDCQLNLKQIALAMRQYCADYDNQMPSRGTVVGWRGAMAPYAKKTEIFRCPGVKNDSNLTDYWFNARLSGAHLVSISHSSRTLLLGDGYSNADPRVALSELPPIWRVDDLSPAQRHLGGANYAFVDGHVKFSLPLQISTASPQTTPLTFALK